MFTIIENGEKQEIFIFEGPKTKFFVACWHEKRLMINRVLNICTFRVRRCHLNRVLLLSTVVFVPQSSIIQILSLFQAFDTLLCWTLTEVKPVFQVSWPCGNHPSDQCSYVLQPFLCRFYSKCKGG